MTADARAALAERRALLEIDQERQAGAKADKLVESLRAQLAQAESEYCAVASRLACSCGLSALSSVSSAIFACESSSALASALASRACSGPSACACSTRMRRSSTAWGPFIRRAL